MVSLDVAKLLPKYFNFLSRVHRRYRRQTDDRRICDDIKRANVT